jgi:hypothetical protein
MTTCVTNSLNHQKQPIIARNISRNASRVVSISVEVTDLWYDEQRQNAETSQDRSSRSIEPRIIGGLDGRGLPAAG